MRIAGHRGTRLHAPENSLQALVSAYTAGADVLEFDLQMTKDGHLVLSHDGDIARLTGERGLIRDMWLKELRHTSGQFDFSATFNPQGVADFKYYRTSRRLQIEIYEQLLDRLPRDVELLIELKHDSAQDDAMRAVFVNKALEALDKRGRLDSVVMYSKDPAVIRELRAKSTEVRLAAFDWELSPADQLGLIDDLEADGLVIDVANIVGTDGALTELGEDFARKFASDELRVGAVLYPYRRPGVFTAAEFTALKDHEFVWSLSTDSMIGAVVKGSHVDIAGLLGCRWPWIEEDFAGTSVDRDRWALGYAKAHSRADDNANIYQNNGIHIDTTNYTGWLPPCPSNDPLIRRVEDLELRMLYAEKSWPFYTGGGVGLISGIVGDFVAEVDYRVDQPLTQATTLEMAVLNVDPGSHQASPPSSFRGKDSFYDPHGAPPYVGVEHDEDDGYRINWNLGSEYDSNQYGPPVGDGRTPRAGRLRLERRGAFFSAYYRNEVDAPDWICVGVIENQSLNNTVFLRCAAKRWRQEVSGNLSQYYPITARAFTFSNLSIWRWKHR